MINLFQRIKHWQLFLALILPLLLFFPLMFAHVTSNLLAAVDKTRLPDPNLMLRPLLWMPALALVPMLLVCAWHWSVGVGMHHLLPQGMKMRQGLFKAAIIVPLVYMCLIMSGLVMLPDVLINMDNNPKPELIGMVIMIPIVVLLHLASIAGLFYSIWHCAKVLKSVELQREARGSEYIGEFFLFWFNYIGIWILQPRINRIERGEIGPKQDDFFTEYSN